MMWWFGAAAAVAQTCPDRGELLAGFRDVVTRQPSTASQDVRDQLVAAFGCGGRAETTQLVGLWLAVAADREEREGLDAANEALRSARRLAGLFDDAYGPDLKRRWQDAMTVPMLPSRLDVEPTRETYPLLLVDGLRFEPPGLLEAGTHLVQWGNTDDDIAGAKIVRTQADQTLTIDVPYGGPSMRPTDPTGPTSEPKDPGKRRSSAPLVVASIAGVGSLVTAGLTAVVGPDANAPGANDGCAQPGEDLKCAIADRFNVQRAMGFTSFGLMAISGVSLGIHIVR